jgi:hypothetical protein
MQAANQNPTKPMPHNGTCVKVGSAVWPTTRCQSTGKAWCCQGAGRGGSNPAAPMRILASSSTIRARPGRWFAG